MNKITQYQLVRTAFVKMLKAYSPYEGKNLNRYKKLLTIDSLFEEFENTPPPFELNGVCSGVIIDHSNVELTRLREKIKEIEESLYELDLFESSYLEEYRELRLEIKRLAEKQREIKIKFKNLPSYLLDDLIDIK